MAPQISNFSQKMVKMKLSLSVFFNYYLFIVPFLTCLTVLKCTLLPI